MGCTKRVGLFHPDRNKLQKPGGPPHGRRRSCKGTLPPLSKDSKKQVRGIRSLSPVGWALGLEFVPNFGDVGWAPSLGVVPEFWGRRVGAERRIAPPQLWGHGVGTEARFWPQLGDMGWVPSLGFIPEFWEHGIGTEAGVCP